MAYEENQAKIFEQRWTKLGKVLQENNLDALVLNPGQSLVYFSGLHFHVSERPVTFIFVPGHEPYIVIPELEHLKIHNAPYPMQSFLYSDEPSGWQAVFRLAAHSAGLDGKRIGIEPRKLRLLEYRYLNNAAPEADFIPAEDAIAQLRMYKDADEIMAMRIAAGIAEKALLAILPMLKTGISEREIAAELTLQLLRNGSDSDVPFAPIVSAGPNSANPHATPTDRTLTEGDLLVIDWGASYQGYLSDITRTFMIGEPDDEEIKICDIVLEANQAGQKAVRPGTTAHQVDLAARSVIEATGYGNFFTHRTGHGLGMEGHEEPYIRVGNDQILGPGMAFTIEPGIYIPGRNGVRIEDDVIVTADGFESLTNLPRKVRRIL